MDKKDTSIFTAGIHIARETVVAYISPADLHKELEWLWDTAYRAATEAADLEATVRLTEEVEAAYRLNNDQIGFERDYGSTSSAKWAPLPDAGARTTPPEGAEIAE